MKIQIDFIHTGTLNEDQTELTVYMSSEGWDSHKQWRADMEAAAENQHDGINEPVWEALEPLGLTLSDEDHEFDEDDECIVYKIEKLVE